MSKKQTKNKRKIKPSKDNSGARNAELGYPAPKSRKSKRNKKQNKKSKK